MASMRNKRSVVIDLIKYLFIYSYGIRMVVGGKPVQHWFQRENKTQPTSEEVHVKYKMEKGKKEKKDTCERNNWKQYKQGKKKF